MNLRHPSTPNLATLQCLALRLWQKKARDDAPTTYFAFAFGVGALSEAKAGIVLIFATRWDAALRAIAGDKRFLVCGLG